jgi:hypothetical protein
MVKDFPGEKWEEVKFDFKYSNSFRLFISNFGRLKTFNKLSNGNIINGSMINGYRIVRLKFFSPRDEKTQVKFRSLQNEVSKLSAKLKSQVQDKESRQQLNEATLLLNTLKKNISKKYSEDTISRTINYHSLIHRLVAEHFIPRPKPGQTVVAHIDFNKTNNHYSNLKWMTPEENYIHQQKSPHVIKEKQERKLGNRSNMKVAKLTVTKVMLLKKLLNKDIPIKQLVKQFKVTDTQILRIKRGENWKHVPAAS